MVKAMQGIGPKFGRIPWLPGLHEMASTAEHNRERNGKQKKWQKEQYQNIPSMFPTQVTPKFGIPPPLYDTLTRPLPWEKTTVTLQIDYCHRTYNLAYLTSDCFLPAKKTTVDTDGRRTHIDAGHMHT